MEIENGVHEEGGGKVKRWKKKINMGKVSPVSRIPVQILLQHCDNDFATLFLSSETKSLVSRSVP